MSETSESMLKTLLAEARAALAAEKARVDRAEAERDVARSELQVSNDVGLSISREAAEWKRNAQCVELAANAWSDDARKLEAERDALRAQVAALHTHARNLEIRLVDATADVRRVDPAHAAELDAFVQAPMPTDDIDQVESTRATQVAALREALVQAMKELREQGHALGPNICVKCDRSNATLSDTAKAAADYRARVRREALEETAKVADEWGSWYPLDVFPNVEVDYSAELTKTLVSRISGSMGRHVASGIAKDIRALAEKDET